MSGAAAVRSLRPLRAVVGDGPRGAGDLRFARALQRGIGTVVGAVAGAVLLALVHGTWLLIPFAVLAALLPFGRSRNYGLLATFLTPLVVVLIDLLSPAGGWPRTG